MFSLFILFLPFFFFFFSSLFLFSMVINRTILDLSSRRHHLKWNRIVIFQFVKGIVYFCNCFSMLDSVESYQKENNGLVVNKSKLDYVQMFLILSFASHVCLRAPLKFHDWWLRIPFHCCLSCLGCRKAILFQLGTRQWLFH